MKLYCMETPKGRLLYDTVERSKTECWFRAFGYVSEGLGPEWAKRYWKRLQPSMVSARNKGWRLVVVRVVKE